MKYINYVTYKEVIFFMRSRKKSGKNKTEYIDRNSRKDYNIVISNNVKIKML